jgi:hypothetical protein
VRLVTVKRMCFAFLASFLLFCIIAGAFQTALASRRARQTSRIHCWML